MSAVFRDGTYQSVSEKMHPQRVAAGDWQAGRWIEDAGPLRAGLEVLAPGTQAIAYAFRLIPPGARRVFLPGTRARFRVQRYPIDPEDNGTWWSGYFPVTGASFYYAATFPDHKGGELGHKYGADLQVTRGVVVDQFKLVLFPWRG